MAGQLDLKPCPFCGNKNVYYLSTITGSYMITCQECGAHVAFRFKIDKDLVIDAWNRRGETDDAREGD